MPALDLSKVQKDSEESTPFKIPAGMTDQEYLEYLENRSQLTESVESYARHEELKERKN